MYITIYHPGPGQQHTGLVPPVRGSEDVISVCVIKMAGEFFVGGNWKMTG